MASFSFQIFLWLTLLGLTHDFSTSIYDMVNEIIVGSDTWKLAAKPVGVLQGTVHGDKTTKFYRRIKSC